MRTHTSTSPASLSFSRSWPRSRFSKPPFRSSPGPRRHRAVGRANLAMTRPDAAVRLRADFRRGRGGRRSAAGVSGADGRGGLARGRTVRPWHRRPRLCVRIPRALDHARFAGAVEIPSRASQRRLRRRDDELRTHPVEIAWRHLWLFVTVWILGVPAAAVVAFRVLSAVNGIFEHANIRVRPAVDAALSWVWVTPQMHKVHHSRDQAETDTNYGNLLALHDRLFGTFVPTERALSVKYGLDDVDPAENPIVRRAARDAVAVEERAGSCSRAGRLEVGPDRKLNAARRVRRCHAGGPRMRVRSSSRSAERCCSAVSSSSC